MQPATQHPCFSATVEDINGRHTLGAWPVDPGDDRNSLRGRLTLTFRSGSGSFQIYPTPEEAVRIVAAIELAIAWQPESAGEPAAEVAA